MGNHMFWAGLAFFLGSAWLNHRSKLNLEEAQRVCAEAIAALKLEER